MYIEKDKCNTKAIKQIVSQAEKQIKIAENKIINNLKDQEKSI